MKEPQEKQAPPICPVMSRPDIRVDAGPLSEGYTMPFFQPCIGSKCVFWKPEKKSKATGPGLWELVPTGAGSCGMVQYAEIFPDPAKGDS